MTLNRRPRRRIDAMNVFVVVVGFLSGLLGYHLVVSEGLNPLIMVPSIVVVTLSLPRVVKIEAPRDAD